MKIYRCLIGCLLVFFIVVGVWYIVSCINERQTTEGGTLIFQSEEQNDLVKGVERIVSGYDLC